MKLTCILLFMLSFIVVTSVQVLIGAATTSSSMQVSIAKEKESVECRIALDLEINGQELELRITDKKLIQKLVQEPMKKARKDDPHPPRYRGLGTLYIKYKDGSTVKRLSHKVAAAYNGI